MGPDPSFKHCQCVTGYTYDPETHTCEGEWLSLQCHGSMDHLQWGNGSKCSAHCS